MGAWIAGRGVAAPGRVFGGIIDSMPSRKQRRRRQKLQRHEYEYVVETEEGEVPLEEYRDSKGDERENGHPKREDAPLDRRGRPIQKPTLQRVLRRALIFAPILVLFVYLTSGDQLAPAGIVLNALILIAFFIPFSYFVDSMVYRASMRRYEKDRAAKRSG
jgi:hypothetical protein